MTIKIVILSFIKIAVDFLLDLLMQFINEWFLGSLKYIGAFAKSIFKKKPYREILKENWNTRIGFFILFILIYLIIMIIEKF